MGRQRKRKYVYKDPETEARAKANLRRGKESGNIKKIITKTKRLQDIDILEFATGKDYLGLSFKERPAQEVILRIIYGLPLNEGQLKIYQKITKNKNEFEVGEVKSEAVLVLGARSGKSLIASIIALYEGTRKKWAKYLNKGESGYIVVIATRQKQAEQIIGANCLRLMENSYYLKGLIKDSTQSELILKNGMRIISLPCNSTAGRGLPIACLIFDEIAHFYTEGVRADETIFNSLRPRQAQFPGAKLILISTPSAKQGLLWNFFEEGFKIPGRLTAQAETLFMNPLVDKKFLEKEKARDIDNYLREFEAQFAEKVEAFLSYDLVTNALKLAGDLPYNAGYLYYAGIDASGLSGRDKFSLAIVHKQGDNVYVDKILSWDLKDPDPIMKDIKELAGIYHFNKASIDKYAKGWVLNALTKIGLEVKLRPSLADIYVNIKSLMLGNRLYLPDNQGLKKALLNVQAFYGRNNALSIAHPRDAEGHSDDIDAVSTAVFEVTSGEESKQGIEGTYLGRQFQVANNEGQIGSFLYDETFPVYTAWNLVIGDFMAIIFYQLIGNKVVIIDYHEATGYSFVYYAKVLKEKGYLYGEHYAPFDIEDREYGAGSKKEEIALSRLEKAKEVGITFKPVPKASFENSVDNARAIMSRCYFDKEKCSKLIFHLEQWGRTWNDQIQEYTDWEAKNPHKHAGSAFRYMSTVVMEGTHSTKGKWLQWEAEQDAEALARANRYTGAT